MTYKKIVPEIMVDLGDNTIYENPNASTAKKILKLHINLENWLGDDLLTNHPVFIVTENLKEKLDKNIYSGFLFDDMEVTKDIYFKDNYHLNKALPKFFWMKINGKKGNDDLYEEDFDLYASERFIKYLQGNFTTNNLEINPERNEFDDFIDKMIADRKNKK
jgi:hypothetical protein